MEIVKYYHLKETVMFVKRLFGRTQVFLALATVIVSGCGHPYPTNEVYQGWLPQALKGEVYIGITRWGADDYREGAEQVWVKYPDGTVLRLSWLEEDPSFWQVAVRHPDGREEIIPLKKYGEAFMGIVHEWPGEQDFERGLK